MFKIYRNELGELAIKGGNLLYTLDHDRNWDTCIIHEHLAFEAASAMGMFENVYQTKSLSKAKRYLLMEELL